MNKNNRLIAAFTIVTFVFCGAFHLASAKAGYSHYRDLHLGAAIHYAQNSIDLLRPIIVGFNATGTPTLQEVPFWQAFAAAIFRYVGSWFGWANLLSLILFACGLWPLYAVASFYLGRRGGWWALLLCLTQPLLILVSGQASADGLSFALALWFLFFANKLVRTGRPIWLLPAAVFASLSAVTKIPLYLCVAFASCLLLFLQRPFVIRKWIALVTVGVVSGLVFLAWTRYTNSCLAVAEFPFVDLRVSYGSPMWFWFFGDWHYRLNPVNWAKGGWSALNCLFGSFALIGPAVWALLFSKDRIGKALFVGAFSATCIFSHLVLVHKHYFILYSPAVALLGAAGILQFEKLLNLRRRWQQICAETAVWAILLLSAVQGLIGMEVILDYDSYPHDVARIVAENTGPQDKLLIQGGGWGGEVLILSQRNGMSIWDTRLLEQDGNLDRLLSLGYNRLVMVSESPLLHSLQKTNPGSLSRQRISYLTSLTSIANPWRTVFQSDDVLIKELPATSAR